MMRIQARAYLRSAATIALASSAPVFAQGTAVPTHDASSASAPSDTSAVAREAASQKIGDIVVVARRRSEAIQSVPITITALSGSQLEQKGIRSTEDLRTAVPSLNIAGQRRDDAQFFIRGQGPGVLQTLQHNFTSVATYFAEVPATVSGPGVFYDLQSVQVLKGPQGTLFGRNTTGGAVLFEPNRPTQTNGGYAQISAGNYSFKQFDGVVNAAIVPDKIALRIATEISRRDGFTKSVITDQKLDGRKYEAIRGSLLLTPITGLENLTIVDYRSKDNSGGSAVLRAVNPGAPLSSTALTSPVVSALTGIPLGTVFPISSGGVVGIGCLSAALPGCPTGPYGNAIAAYSAAYNGGNFSNPANSGFAIVAPTAVQLATLAEQQALGPRRNLSPKILRSKALDYGITNKTSLEITDNLTLKNIVAYRVSRQNASADFDGTPLNFLENIYVTDQPWGTSLEQFTEEFQAQGKIPALNLVYIAGFYHEFSKPGMIEEGDGPALGVDSIRRANFKDESNAVFGHVEWNPISLIGISAGIRHTWDKRYLSLSLTDGTGTCTQAIPGTSSVECPISGAKDFGATTYDATVNIKPMSHLLIYGSFRHGYKSGGINLPAPEAPPPLSPDAYSSFAAETVDSFEIGLKGDFNIGIPVRANIALFHDRYKNEQVAETVVFTPAGATAPIAVPLILNGVNALNEGVEFETTIVPLKGVSLSGFMSYLDAAPTNDLAGVAVKGRQAMEQPKWKYGVSGNFTLPISADLGSLDLQVDYSWQSSVYTTPTPTLVNTDPAYGIVNARLQWDKVSGSQFDLAVFCTNLTNKTYILGGYPIGALGFDSVIYGEPRMYGMSARVNF